MALIKKEVLQQNVATNVQFRLNNITHKANFRNKKRKLAKNNLYCYI